MKDWSSQSDFWTGPTGRKNLNKPFIVKTITINLVHSNWDVFLYSQKGRLHLPRLLYAGFSPRQKKRVQKSVYSNDRFNFIECIYTVTTNVMHWRQWQPKTTVKELNQTLEQDRILTAFSEIRKNVSKPESFRRVPYVFNVPTPRNWKCEKNRIACHSQPGVKWKHPFHQKIL